MRLQMAIQCQPGSAQRAPCAPNVPAPAQEEEPASGNNMLGARLAHGENVERPALRRRLREPTVTSPGEHSASDRPGRVDKSLHSVCNDLSACQMTNGFILFRKIILRISNLGKRSYEPRLRPPHPRHLSAGRLTPGAQRGKPEDGSWPPPASGTLRRPWPPRLPAAFRPRASCSPMRQAEGKEGTEGEKPWQ